MDLEGLPVSSGEINGIVTVMDILRFFGSGKVFKYLRSGLITQVLQTPISEIAAKNVITTILYADLGEVARLMRENNIGAPSVVENSKLVGMVIERDFFKIIA